MSRRVPSLVDLSVQVAIDNVRYLGDVGETDFQFLERILPHCTLDQLIHIEQCTKGRDLSPVTNPLWKKFYERRFGANSVEIVVERMEKVKVKFPWRKLYEAKVKEEEAREEKISARVREGYRIEEAKKQNRKIQLCNKAPPSRGKRNFYGGPYGCISNTKSNIMKKAKLEFINSREVKNLTAMKSKAVQRTQSVSHARTSSSFSHVSSPSTSRNTKCKGILEGTVKSTKISSFSHVSSPSASRNTERKEVSSPSTPRNTKRKEVPSPSTSRNTKRKEILEGTVKSTMISSFSHVSSPSTSRNTERKEVSSPSKSRNTKGKEILEGTVKSTKISSFSHVSSPSTSRNTKRKEF